MIKKAVFYIAVALLIFGGQFFINRGLVTGKPPLIKEPTLAGFTVMTPIIRGPAIIYFWAEWCGICKMMQDSVSAVLQTYPGITVAVRSGGDQNVRHYLHEQNLGWVVVNDTKGGIANRYGVNGVPAVFFVNADGEIMFSAVGFTSEAGLRIRMWLVGLL